MVEVLPISDWIITIFTRWLGVIKVIVVIIPINYRLVSIKPYTPDFHAHSMFFPRDAQALGLAEAQRARRNAALRPGAYGDCKGTPWIWTDLVGFNGSLLIFNGDLMDLSWIFDGSLMDLWWIFDGSLMDLSWFLLEIVWMFFWALMGLNALCWIIFSKLLFRFRHHVNDI